MPGLAELDREIAKRRKGIVINGFLDLRSSGITRLPNNLTVRGNLFLSKTGITQLPDNLTVEGSLYLSGTGIVALPETLTVRGSLNLSGTGIKTLPDKLTVGGIVHGLEENNKPPKAPKSDHIAQEYQCGQVSQCTEEIRQMWTAFYSIIDTTQKRNPLFKERPLPLAFMINKFVMEALESVGAKYPFARPGPGSLLWDMVCEAVCESRTCPDGDVKLALKEIQKQYSA